MNRLAEAYALLDRYVEQTMQAARTPGMAVALTDRDRTLRITTYGVADIGRRTPVTPETLFEIGSLGKTFTSLAVMQQVEAGRLDLHAPIRRYLPWFHVPSVYAPITIHHLLNHSAGIISGAENFAPDTRYEAWALRETEAAFPPGRHHHYSDIGYKVLGFLLEEVLGQPYDRIVRTGILEPLGMAATTAAITHDTRRRLATGYASLYDDRPAHRSHPLVPATWLETNCGAGSMASTPADMAAFLRMLLNRGRVPRGPIVAPHIFDLMTQRVVETRSGTYYGYGLRVWERDGFAHLAHGGDMPGYEAVWRVDMDNGLGAVALMNGPLAAGVSDYALRVLRAAVLGHDLPPPLVPDPATIDNAADYAGRYVAGHMALTLRAAGERLILEHGGQHIPLERYDGDSFYVNHPDFALFLLTFGRQDGAVVEACHGPDWYAGERYDGPTTFEYPRSWEPYCGHYRAHNPWRTNFRVVLRKGALLLINPSGEDEPLAPLENGSFRVGIEDYSPERLRFDAIVNGRAQRATLSGCDYYRFFTP